MSTMRQDKEDFGSVIIARPKEKLLGGRRVFVDLEVTSLSSFGS
ncbi:hypothetical protein V7122_15845 [Bacillus sp. JJ1532]